MRLCSSKNAAFSLIELTLALGVAAFCLIAVFGLMPVGVLTNRNAISQTAATNIVAAVIADLRATPSGVSPSAQFAINFPANATSPTDPPPCSGTQTLYFNGEGQAATAMGADTLSTDRNIREEPSRRHRSHVH
jgi:Tfp pilus assembly protein PilV